MTDLITRLEAASEGSRELDLDIAEFVDEVNPNAIKNCRDFQSRNGRLPYDNIGMGEWLPNFTTSLEAAWNYVPDSFHVVFLLEKRGHDDEPYNPTFQAGIEQWVIGGNYFTAQAPTPALALCIAALKAREQNDTSDS